MAETVPAPAPVVPEPEPVEPAGFIARIKGFWFGLPDFIRRPIRTFAQAVAAFAAANIAALIANAFGGDIDIQAWLSFGEQALIAGGIAVAALFQNWLEERAGAAR